MRISASLAAGGAAEKAAVIFRKHDVDQDNFLNKWVVSAAGCGVRVVDVDVGG